MKRQVLSILSTLALSAAFGCRTTPEPERQPVPTQRPEERSYYPDETLESPDERMDGEMQRPTAELSNEVIHDHVFAALQQEEDLDASRIRVIVEENGVVRLSGTVPSEEQKRRAHEIAQGVEGVQRVEIDQLEIDTAQATR